MSIVNLYNGIYRVLANDEEILTLLGLTKDVDLLTKAKHIQKRSRPQKLLENLPLIAFYTPGGKLDGNNDRVYSAQFIFDIYTADDPETALKIVQRIIDLFEGKIHPFKGVENFEARFLSGYESVVDADNIYCFSIVIEMNISLCP